MYNEDFITAVEDVLRTEPEQLISENSVLKDLAIWEDDAFLVLAQSLLKKICQWSPHSTEKIVQILFEKSGFTRVHAHHYDGKGGDIDLLFNMPTENILGGVIEMNGDPFSVVPKIHVQVKKKIGRDNADVIGVQQLIKMMDDNTPAISILMSTADGFSPECKELAKKHDVLLIDGIQFAKLLVKYGIECVAPV